MIRPEKLDDVKKQLQRVEVNWLTMSSVSGYGTQRGNLELERIKAKKHEAKLLKKSRLKFQ